MATPGEVSWSGSLFLMKRILYLIILLAFASGISAADTKPVKVKTLLSEAKAAIKNNRNQANAEKNLMDNVAREDVTKSQRAEMYFMAQELERSMNAAENLKFYLKQPYDTIKFFSTILKMHEYLLICDSIETEPDDLGQVKYRYHNRGREIMTTYRPNLLNGGKFLLKRNKYAEAFPYFDMYIRTARSDFFLDVFEFRNDTLLPHVAYWATVSAYNANQAKEALRYIDDAISGADSTLRVSLQEYKVRCYESLKDSDNWVKNLLEGVRLYPAHDYFFLHLMDYYSEGKHYDTAIALCDSMLHRVGDRAIYWYGQSQMYVGKEQYDSCIVVSNEALRLDSQMVDAYYNKGISYLNKAVAFAATACNDIRDPKCREDRQTLLELYRNAKEPMEQVRKLMPDDSKRWAQPLYRIYLNLNMGDEFAEMEKILNAK